jgi:threonine dehydrogenase-like Zn-dependent dehydrogenase
MSRVRTLNPERLAQAGALGAHVAAGEDSVAEVLPGGADLVVDCVGAAATKRDSLRRVRSGGTVVFLGLHDNETPLFVARIDPLRNHSDGIVHVHRS